MRPALKTVLLFGVMSIAPACNVLPELLFEDGGTSPSEDAGRVDASVAGRSDAATTTGDAAIGGSSSGGESSSGAGSGGSGSSGVGSSSSGSASGGSSSSSGGEDAGVCASGPPPGATACCYGIPCVGKKCAQRCSDCKICNSSQTCCIPNANSQATCATNVSGC